MADSPFRNPKGRSYPHPKYWTRPWRIDINVGHGISPRVQFGESRTLGSGYWWKLFTKYLATYRVVFHIIDIYCFCLYIDKYFLITYAAIYWSKFWQLSNHGQEKKVVQIDRTLGPQRGFLKIRILHKRLRRYSASFSAFIIFLWPIAN